MLLPGKMEGIGYFTFETMKRITNQHPEHDFTFIFDRDFDPAYLFSDNVKAVSIFPPARHPILWYIWYEWSLPYIFRKIKPDLFIGTDGYLPLSSKTPSLAVIHDLNFEHFPQDLPFFNRLYYRYYFHRFARRASHIATVSEFTKNDIMRTYNIASEKIEVVYNGAGDQFKPVNEIKAQAIREKYAHGKPYFLFVGALHQRKNIANLFRAFEDFKNKISSPLQLILTGQKRWWTKEMEDVFNSMKHKEDVIFTGRVSEESLQEITAGALAATYVSSFEGFGIPIIEAMKCGVPVITSNCTSMPEIAGDAALLCDPFSFQSISDAMFKIYSDEACRKSLIEKGLNRQQNFTWQKTADKLWLCIENVREIDN
jgi:glycosyltransferase involved in cell wall biosynthesis